jgi:hypothetical protein
VVRELFFPMALLAVLAVDGWPFEDFSTRTLLLLLVVHAQPLTSYY